MWNYYNPVEIIFGENRFQEVHNALKDKSYIIITHPEEIFKKYSDELKTSSNPPLTIMTEVQPNPDYKDILELLLYSHDERKSMLQEKIKCSHI